MKTLRDKFAAALIKRGSRQVEGRSSKFLTFTRDDATFYFLGAAGSLRAGRTSSTSHRCSDKFKQHLLASLEVS